MQNEILDYEENEQPIKSYRKYYLLIESVIIIPSIWFGGNTFFYIEEFYILFDVVILPFAVIFYLVAPIVRFVIKEFTAKLSLLHFIQNSCFVAPIFLLNYYQYMFGRISINTLIIPLALSFLLFIIIPHFEIKKYNPSSGMYLLIAFIHLSIILSFIGFWQYATSSTTASPKLMPISLGGILLSFSLLFVILFLVVRNWGKYFYLGYYVPRLLFAIILGGFHIVRILSIFRYTYF